MKESIKYRSEIVDDLEVIEYDRDDELGVQSVYRDPWEGTDVTDHLILHIMPHTRNRIAIAELPDDPEWDGVINVYEDML